jgi:hypothetical protein
MTTLSRHVCSLLAAVLCLAPGAALSSDQRVYPGKGLTSKPGGRIKVGKEFSIVLTPSMTKNYAIVTLRPPSLESPPAATDAQFTQKYMGIRSQTYRCSLLGEGCLARIFLPALPGQDRVTVRARVGADGKLSVTKAYLGLEQENRTLKVLERAVTGGKDGAPRNELFTSASEVVLEQRAAIPLGGLVGFSTAWSTLPRSARQLGDRIKKGEGLTGDIHLSGNGNGHRPPAKGDDYFEVSPK